MHKHRLLKWALGLIAVVALAIVPVVNATDEGSSEQTLGSFTTEQSTITPDRPSEPLSPSARSEGARLHRGLIELRREEAAEAAARPQEPTPQRELSAAAAEPQAESRFHGTPGAFIFASRENTLADDGGRASEVSEPSAVSEGRHVMMAGNWYRSRSSDGGTTWTNIPIGAGPTEAPNFCCDIDTVYDQARGVTLQSLLYGRNFDADPKIDNGVVRIVVRRQMDLGDNCVYTIDPDGATNDVVPDFPHIALSNNSLYLATNDIKNSGGQTARMYRYNLDEIADCASTTGGVFSLPSSTLGQRVFRPVDGATTAMYWGALVGSTSSTTLRVYKWPEGSSTITSVDVTLGETSNFGDTDCRGGTNNTDWWDPLTASITGFELVGAVGGNTLQFLWDVKGGGSHTQGHIHGVKLRAEPSIAKTANVLIQNGNFCLGFPAIASNERGDFGLSLSAGGKSGGAGPAIRSWAGLDDDLDGGTTDFVTVRTGTHNPAGGRFGDYSTVHQSEPCDQFFSATNYIFRNGGGATNVDALYITFGRGRETPCFNGWSDEDRIP
jgi:hypothetical protein